MWTKIHYFSHNYALCEIGAVGQTNIPNPDVVDGSSANKHLYNVFTSFESCFVLISYNPYKNIIGSNLSNFNL